MKRTTFFAVLVAASLYATSASAGVWFELLHAPCWTADENDPNNVDPVTGEVSGGIDCFNQDFNGDAARTILSIKAFQPWEYGFMFLYYDITGPFNNPGETIATNEKGGFFGGTTVALSVKRIGQKITGSEFNWGPLADVSLKYEIEHVSKFGALHYVGFQWDWAVPFLDFLSTTTVVRQDTSLDGVDLQLGAAWQKSFSLGPADFIFGGFFQWGVFGEGEGNLVFGEPPNTVAVPTEGNSFFLTQPQILLDVGKLIKFTPAKLYAGFEYQFTINRYLIQDKSENTLQGMIRWNI